MRRYVLLLILLMVVAAAALAVMGWSIYRAEESHYGTIRGVVRVDGKPRGNVEFVFYGGVGGGAVTVGNHVSDIPPTIFEYRVKSNSAGEYSVSRVKPNVVYRMWSVDRKLTSFQNGELTVVPGTQIKDVDFVTPK